MQEPIPHISPTQEEPKLKYQTLSQHQLQQIQ